MAISQGNTETYRYVIEGALENLREQALQPHLAKAESDIIEQVEDRVVDAMGRYFTSAAGYITREDKRINFLVRAENETNPIIRQALIREAHELEDKIVTIEERDAINALGRTPNKTTVGIKARKVGVSTSEDNNAYLPAAGINLYTVNRAAWNAASGVRRELGDAAFEINTPELQRCVLINNEIVKAKELITHLLHAAPSEGYLMQLVPEMLALADHPLAKEHAPSKAHWRKYEALFSESVDATSLDVIRRALRLLTLDLAIYSSDDGEGHNYVNASLQISRKRHNVFLKYAKVKREKQFGNYISAYLSPPTLAAALDHNGAYYSGALETEMKRLGL